MAESTNVEGNLKWMYEGRNSSIDHEQYLLGKRITTLHEEEDDKGDFLPKTESSIGTGNITVLEKLDYESKVREDPLFEIKKKELEHRKEILSNPLKKKRIQNMLKRALERDLKRNLSKQQNRESDSSSSESGDSSESDDESRKLSKKLKDKHLRDVLKRKLESELKSHKRKESSSSEEDYTRKKRRHYSSDKRNESRHSTTKERHSTSHKTKKHSRDEEKHSSRHCSSSEERRSPSRERQEKKAGYGLIHVKGNTTTVKREKKKRRERRTPTPEPEKPKYVRKHKAGFSRKLSEKELEKRRKEMMQNAEWRDDQRKVNVKKYAMEEKKEKEREEKIQKIKQMAEEKGMKAKDFLHDMKLHSASVGSLADTVRRKKHTLNKKL